MGAPPAPRPPGRPGSGYSVISLCLAAATLVTTPLLLLPPVAAFIPVVLAAAGIVFAWIGLRRSGRRTGFAVTGFIISIMLLGLTLSIAVLWTRLVVFPAIHNYPELQVLSGTLLVAGGLLLRRRQI